MSRLHRIAASVTVISALSVSAVMYGQQRGAATGASSVAANVTGDILRRASTAKDALPGSWLSYGRDQSETRYSTLKQINASNAHRLGPVWSYVMGSGGSNQEGTPLVWNNTLYGITAWSVVFALDARNGKEIWRWDPQIDQRVTRPAICCGIVNRGVALYNGMIIAPAIDGRMFALDARTGKPIWETRLVDSKDLLTLTMAPRVAGGKVIIGAAGGDRPTRGVFFALDAQTGKVAWQFYTVPGDPSQPFENEAMRIAAKTWGPEFHKVGGGGAVWDGFAYDPDANLVYVGTGNPMPWVQNFRTPTGLDALYTCSILAVDLTTGQLKWHYQAVPNDTWDYDNVQHLMLLDLTINGRQRKVITQAAKNGFFYVLDRLTGEFISAEPFVQVSWALGVDKKTGRPIINPAAYYSANDPISIRASAGGGHNWSPMSYNPATGLVYIPSSYTPYALGAAEEYKPGTTGFVRPRTEPRVVEPIIGPEPPPGARSGLQAWDPVAQKLRWHVPGGGGIGGGTTTTAGNLVFQVINDGRFRAITADKGEVLYEVRINRTGMAPPITYEVDGTQYVAFAGGLGRPNSVYGPTNEVVEDAPMMFVFALDGKAPLPPPPEEPAPASQGPAPEQRN